MHSSVQRKDSGNKKGKSYKDLPFVFSEHYGSIRLSVPHANSFLFIIHLLR